MRQVEFSLCNSDWVFPLLLFFFFNTFHYLVGGGGWGYRIGSERGESERWGIWSGTWRTTALCNWLPAGQTTPLFLSFYASILSVWNGTHTCPHTYTSIMPRFFKTPKLEEVLLLCESCCCFFLFLPPSVRQRDAERSNSLSFSLRSSAPRLFRSAFKRPCGQKEK